jgi:hypothetical protein
MNNNSKSYQDIFVLNVFDYKKNGTFVELGSRECPISYGNNTLLLEKSFNWEGISFNIPKYNENTYKYNRPNSLVVLNKNIDEINILENLKKKFINKNIDYLQIETEIIDKTTYNILKQLDKTVFNKYKFGVITFRHDFYNGNYYDTRKLGRDILKKHGYIPVFQDIKLPKDNYVSPKQYIVAEDWFVHPKLVNMNFINKIKSQQSLTFLEIKNKLIDNMKIKYFIINPKNEQEIINKIINYGVDKDDILIINITKNFNFELEKSKFINNLEIDEETFTNLYCHYFALKTIVDNNFPYSVLMEDNIKFIFNNIPEKLRLYLKNIYREWDILFDNNSVLYNQEKITYDKLLYRKSNHTGSSKYPSFYFVTLKCAKKLVDNFIPFSNSTEQSFNDLFKKLDMFVYWAELPNVILNDV